MTAPVPGRKRRPGAPAEFLQLSAWLTTATKRRLSAAARGEGRPQRAILEDALADYFAKRARLPEPAAP